MAIGISLYPEHAPFERNAAYMERAAAHGCTRVFSCLLSAEGDRASQAGEFSALSRVCHDYGMEVVLDVAQAVFSRVGARPDDLSFFVERSNSLCFAGAHFYAPCLSVISPSFYSSTQPAISLNLSHQLSLSA